MANQAADVGEPPIIGVARAELAALRSQISAIENDVRRKQVLLARELGKITHIRALLALEENADQPKV